jgi:hypothetical protein
VDERIPVFVANLVVFENIQYLCGSFLVILPLAHQSFYALCDGRVSEVVEENPAFLDWKFDYLAKEHEKAVLAFIPAQRDDAQGV